MNQPTTISTHNPYPATPQQANKGIAGEAGINLFALAALVSKGSATNISTNNNNQDEGGAANKKVDHALAIARLGGINGQTWAYQDSHESNMNPDNDLNMDMVMDAETDDYACSTLAGGGRQWF